MRQNRTRVRPLLHLSFTLCFTGRSERPGPDEVAMSSLAIRARNRIKRAVARRAANLLPGSWLPRAKGRIFDCLMLYREIDLLEIRLNELYDHVDFFVIMESCRTFTGKENQPVFPS